MGGSVLLIIGVFLPWYGVDSVLGIISGHHGKGTYSGWDVHRYISIALLLGAIAPFVLAWIVARNKALSWPRGELTMVIAMIAAVLIVYVGIIDKSGEPPSAISLQYGWFIALLGSLMMFGGAISRQQETETRRKPPGVM